jgi:hypothetical protein
VPCDASLEPFACSDTFITPLMITLGTFPQGPSVYNVSMKFLGPITAGVVFSGVLFVLKLPIIFWQIIGVLAAGFVVFVALRAFGLFDGFRTSQ